MCPRAAGFFLRSLVNKYFFAAGRNKVLANFKTALAARGMKQAELAIELKIAPTVLSEIVHGRRCASPSMRARLAEMLQADEAWLFSSFTRIPTRADSSAHPSVSPPAA